MATLEVEVRVHIPLLAPANMLVFERDVSRETISIARREIGTPNRKKLPVDRGILKKSFRVTRPGRRRRGGRVILAAVKYKFWLHFQKLIWERIKLDIRQEAPGIIRRATLIALRKQGFN